MAEPAQYAWQQLPRETDKAYQAFVVYRNPEPQERSQAGVASECTKSVSLIRRWSSQWSWLERAREWDAHQEMRRLEARIEEKQRMDEEHLKIIRAMRSKALQALAQMETETLASNMYELRNWITDFIKYECLVMGEPESIEERREKVEIQATIEERLKTYAPVFQGVLPQGQADAYARWFYDHLDPLTHLDAYARGPRLRVRRRRHPRAARRGATFPSRPERDVSARCGGGLRDCASRRRAPRWGAERGTVAELHGLVSGALRRSV
jgi:hypothetical protein